MCATIATNAVVPHGGATGGGLLRSLDGLRLLRSSLLCELMLCSTSQHNVPVVVKRASIHRAKHWLVETNQRCDSPWQERCVVRRLMQAPAHRHIVQFLDETMTTTDFFIAMEHCARGDLWEILSKHERGHFDECETATMIRGVALAVQYLHEVIGVAHRDLSVENILVTAENVCKISDFGLSTDANKLTNTKVGKEYYMAPEVAAGKWYDPKKADVWSLGIVLFVMLTGSPLVKIADPSDRVFRAIEMYGPASVLTALGMHGRVSLCMLDLLCQMLVVDPKRRITLSDVVRFLEEWELDG